MAGEGLKIAKRKIKLGYLTLGVGIFLQVISYLAYLYLNSGFIGEVQSEVFGVGAGLFVIGLALIIFKKRIG